MPAPTIDGRLINGVLPEPGTHPDGFSFNAGTIVPSADDTRSWGTVDASRGAVYPGLVTPVRGKTVDELAWARKGITTIALLTGRAGTPTEAPESVLDVVRIATVDSSTTAAEVASALASGIDVFDAAESGPWSEAISAECSVRVCSGSPHLEAWSSALEGTAALLVVAGITPSTLERAIAAKRARPGATLLEVSTDDLAADDDALWNAVARGDIDMCSVPTPQSPSPFPLFATHPRGAGIDRARIAEMTSGHPARAARATRRKGSLAPGMDADAVVVDADTPGVDGRPAGTVNLVLRRGDFLLLHGQVHTKPGSGTTVCAQRKGDPAHA